MKLKSIKKRNLLLLEVMIAFALIALCALPIIAPHTWMLEDDLREISYLRRQALADAKFVALAERLYYNQIPFEAIKDGFLEGDLTEGLVYMKSRRRKAGRTDNETYYLVDLTISFQNKEEKEIEKKEKKGPMKFSYTFFIARKVPIGKESAANEPPLDEPTDAENSEGSENSGRDDESN